MSTIFKIFFIFKFFKKFYFREGESTSAEGGAEGEQQRSLSRFCVERGAQPHDPKITT